MYQNTHEKMSDEILNYECENIVNENDVEEKLKKLHKIVSAKEEELSYQTTLLFATQNKLLTNERIYQLISEVSADGFHYINYTTNFSIASNKWFEFFPVREGQMRDKAILRSFIYEEDKNSYIKRRMDCYAGKEDFFEESYRLRDDTWVKHYTKFIYDENNDLCEEINVFQDITKQKKQQERLEHLAYYDHLTGAYNRTYFIRWLDEKIEEAHRDNKLVQLLYIDIDYFKRVNDSMGFKIGDELILKMSEILERFRTDNIKIGRFSNDEFAIGLSDVDSSDAADIIYEKLLEKLKQPIFLSNGVEYYLTISAGMAEYDYEIGSGLELVRAADLAMYHAKNMGRNGIWHYERKMMNNFINSISLEQRLKVAIEKENFYLVFQPQFDAITEKLRGVEELIRWNDEEYGMISPSEFIPLAEENGGIIKLGAWIIRESLKALSSWRDNYNYTGIISINISTVQFRDASFMDTLKYFTELYEIEPGKVEIEVTESVFIDDFNKMVEQIKELRSIGYKISLDDFGTGYSSLSYLKEIPMDTLKIDQSFVASIVDEESTCIITSSVIEMVQKLGLETIAEGVETKEQLEYLKKINCDVIQGYLLGRPIEESEIVKIIKLNNHKPL
ncbi:MAG: bifunctional diguanylate cyclase/phosphodiesterase [Clostridiales bacterium]|nr:bifunctional diguanylate cyclase/phosphodiesterase [Clostridiales bacterium]